MPPAARVGDLHACANPAHVGGPVTIGSATVRIGGAPAARVGDQASCQGPADTLSQGSPTVFIEGRPAARAGDPSLHAGTILTGCDTVIIGNSSYAGGGIAGGTAGATEPGTGSDAAGAKSTPGEVTLNGKRVSPQVLNSLVSIARGIAAGGDNPATMSALATALEVALARNDLFAIRDSASGLQALLQNGRNKPPDSPAGGEAKGAGSGPAAAKGRWKESVLADPPGRVEVRDGRVMVNGHHAGIHAISEFDLVALQTKDQVHEIVQRLGIASAAGRNCARLFCMYRHAGGELSPWTTPRYWESMDLVIRRLASYGMFPDLVLFADCERRADGSGGVMPSWDARRAFAREAGLFLKGRPVIVNGMNEPPRNGATGADDPRLMEVMQIFKESSGGTVPFSIGDPPCGDSGIESTRAAQQLLARSGASLIVLHGSREEPTDRAYRSWIDRLQEFAALHGTLEGNPYLYHNEPMGFASRRQLARRDDDPEAAVAAACVCAIAQMGFCYHRVATEDPATPGLDLARVATLIQQAPDFRPHAAGAAGSPIARYDERDAPGGGLATCSNGQESWAVLYGRHVAKSPRVEWRGQTPEVIWRGERVVLWRAR